MAAVHEKGIKVSGAVTFWSLTDRIDLKVLKEGFAAVGMEGCVPEERSALSALKAALVKVAGDRNRLIRELPVPELPANAPADEKRAKRVRGYTVVDEAVKGEREMPDGSKTTILEYEESYCVALVAGDVIVFDRESPEAEAVKAAYDEERNIVTEAAVSRAMVRVLDKLSATTLRPTGGVYYIPDANLYKWEKVAEAVRAAVKAGGDGTADVYLIRTNLDDDAVKAVAAAMAREIETEASALEADLGEAGKRALETRAARAVALTKKVEFYETTLGTVIDKAKVAKAEAEIRAVMDNLEAMAASGPASAEGLAN
jgi:hypothetical protein